MVSLILNCTKITHLDHRNSCSLESNYRKSQSDLDIYIPSGKVRFCFCFSPAQLINLAWLEANHWICRTFEVVVHEHVGRIYILKLRVHGIARASCILLFSYIVKVK